MSRKSCPNKENNLKDCHRNWPGCERKLICCECIAYHKKEEKNQFV